MKLIKLDATDSTNSFLKGLTQKQNLDSYTVVSAKMQTNGKGQMGSSWVSEEGKNLISSILINNTVTNITAIFNLNITVAVSLLQALHDLNVTHLSIKWPNDIMAGNQKIAGILIENLIKENGEIKSIVGIGLNVNQTDFENLPKASSLKNRMNQDFDIDSILENIVQKIEENVARLQNNETDFFWKTYENHLFKKGKPTLFEANQEQFMGIIQGVTRNGMLTIQLEDDSIKEFGVKEIVMIY
jgi:BirA family biotin operon repressor/biotin-[acetyl-CoA-carboxylase] ligase